MECAQDGSHAIPPGKRGLGGRRDGDRPAGGLGVTEPIGADLFDDNPLGGVSQCELPHGALTQRRCGVDAGQNLDTDLDSEIDTQRDPYRLGVPSDALLPDAPHRGIEAQRPEKLGGNQRQAG